MRVQKIIVFTDLDGSFLDHHDYDYTCALPALNRLKSLNVPVIPTTSKTLAELRALELPFNSTKAIAENGMVVFDGTHEKAVFKRYDEIVAFVQSLPDRLRCCIVGFHDMSLDDLVNYTSLSPDNAAFAKMRLGSEPFLWHGDDKTFEMLEKQANAKGLIIVRGGRFYHLMSAGGGKDKAIETMIKDEPSGLVTIALGDGPNDAAMLGCVDYGIKIPNESGASFVVSNPRGVIIDAPMAGPKGWNLSIHSLLDELRL